MVEPPPSPAARLRALASDVAFWLLWLVFGWILRLWLGVHSHGRPRLQGPCILAPNHASFLDPVVLNACVPRRIVFLMTAMFFHVPWLHWFFRWTGTIPVQEGHSNRDMMQQALAALARGSAVAIFPEGGISRDGRLLPGNHGVAALILRARVPVIPVHIQGTFAAMPRHASWPRPAAVRVRFGEPIPPETWDHLAGLDRKTRLRLLTERVMAEIARLERS